MTRSVNSIRDKNQIYTHVYIYILFAAKPWKYLLPKMFTAKKYRYVHCKRYSGALKEFIQEADGIVQKTVCVYNAWILATYYIVISPCLRTATILSLRPQSRIGI